MKTGPICVLTFIVLFAGVSFAQESILSPARDGSRTPGPPPGNMQLLAGYEHFKRRGYDSEVGEIVKKDGMKIRYDIGDMAGQVLKQKDGKPGYKEIKVNGDTLLVTWNEKGEIVATFVNAYANFFATAKEQGDFVDFLMMVMTYNQPKPDKAKEEKR